MRATFGALLLLAGACFGQTPIRATVDFSRHVRAWDGFGVNYVETAQTRDYQADPQEYGGFSLLTEPERQQILDLIFGPDGLKPGLLKMFLDSHQQGTVKTGKFDHTTTTRWLRYFAKEGLKKTRARGGDLTIITTLYGPPGWMTKQRFVRGRDLDPALKRDVARYMIEWVKFLRNVEGLPVKYISLHNEGEDYVRWPADGSGPGDARHDYNMFWPPEQVVDFLRFMRGMLDQEGLKDVGLTPGETSNWYRFSEWGYASAIAADPEAIKNLGLITSHGFISFGANRWFGDWRSLGNDILRARRPELHSWVTSQSWSKMDVNFINEMRGNIYATKVNGIIPWAAIQRSAKWVGGDPNPGTAFRVSEDGKYTVEPGYYLYKQVAPAGQPGMAVAHVVSTDTEVGLIAFARAKTRQPDAFVVLNLAKIAKPLAIRVLGSVAQSFAAWRTGSEERYAALGEHGVQGGILSYTAPPGTVTTFYGKP
ncbi:MAG: hypothetical protein FJW34_08555 [Acidobacteria bacterium]|nr:hypothetical protein [Acidobacteriota bacterium]